MKANTIAEGTYPVKSLPHGEFIKKTPDAKKVYQRGAYDRTTKKYELIDVEDINRTTWIKGDALVFAGFTY